MLVLGYQVSPRDLYRTSGAFNVRAYGATGDGSTNDTSAIQAAINAAVAAGGTMVFFPPGNYRIGDGGALWSAFRYCLRVASASDSPLIFRGCGSSSKLSMAAHNDADGNYICFFDVHQSTGRIRFEDLAFETPAPATTGQGRIAITIGDMGGETGSANSGTLDEISVERCVFTNLSFAIHGEGAKRVRFRDNVGTYKGGGLYPTYYCEPINLGSRGNAYESSVLVENNKFSNDSTNGDHVLYFLGQFKEVIVRGNEWNVVNHEAVKFSSWGIAAHETGSILVEENIDTRTEYHSGDAQGESIFLMITGDATTTGSIRELIVRNNRVKFAHQFVYSEAAYDLAIVEGNVATSIQDIAVHFIKKTELALRGHCVIANNDFSAVNVSNANNISVKINAFLSGIVAGNRAKTAAGNGRFIDADTANMEWLVAVGNYATKTAYWYEQGRWATVYDYGNSWNHGSFSRLAGYTNGDTTPSVAGATSMVITNSAPTTITQLDDAEVGQVIVLTFADGNTTIANTNVYTAGGQNFSATQHDCLTLIYTGSGYWKEVSRSVN